MLDVVICPKRRSKAFVGTNRHGEFKTMITCGHFSACVQEYKRCEDMRKWNIGKLKELSELPPIDCRSILDPVWETQGDDRVRESHRSLKGNVFFGMDLECLQPTDIKFTLLGKGLGYSPVPHPTTSGVKGFLYGFK